MLFQQYIVASWIRVEDCRLHWARKNLENSHIETHASINDYVRQATNLTGSSISKIIMMPPNFRSGKRFRLKKYMDALAGVRRYGRHDLFMIVTCNPNWPDFAPLIERRGTHHSDRMDLLSQMIKFEKMIKFLTEDKKFGAEKWLAPFSFGGDFADTL